MFLSSAAPRNNAAWPGRSSPCQSAAHSARQRPNSATSTHHSAPMPQSIPVLHIKVRSSRRSTLPLWHPEPTTVGCGSRPLVNEAGDPVFAERAMERLVSMARSAP